MRHVTGNIRRFDRMRVANVWLLDGGPGDVWLVDTGHVVERAMLVLELRSAGLRPRDVTGVLLTHRHSDHAGNAAWLQRQGVRVHAHRADAEVLAKRAPRPMLDARSMARGGDWLGSMFATIENALPAPSLEVDRALEEGDVIAGLEVHAAPGHTDGSVFYRHEATRSLLSGDTLLNAYPPLTFRSGLTMPYPGYATDLDRAHASIRAFHERAVDYEHLLAGHGPPLLGDARAQVLAMIDAVRST